MDRTLKIVGAIALIIIAVIVIGNIVGFLVKALFWVAVVAAVAFGVTYVIAKAKDKGQLRR
ncbi:hypothetical protein JL107_14055 [Nakamurella flavida]|uniref:Uncharacterized protein n=1 Tax=Nakamurella flavida TaxID=363630 RepID=A0A939C3F0_9ACTN|nr:hypothetical protein [Nakamurella flavida]MBM9477570.1 hypothetical protein [Nakamurella flavida]MDP9779118.1 5-bromo-4-chloroindolyl phosphate hydrolysis protein [Nakamurella flavida]